MASGQIFINEFVFRSSTFPCHACFSWILFAIASYKVVLYVILGFLILHKYFAQKWFCFSDVEKLQKLCAQRPLEGVKLTVSTVPISNSVIVKGLNSVTSDDTILYYFEGKRSGNVNGVEVEKIERKASENYAVVYFKDHTGRNSLCLKNRHKVRYLYSGKI